MEAKALCYDDDIIGIGRTEDSAGEDAYENAGDYILKTAPEDYWHDDVGKMDTWLSELELYDVDESIIYELAFTGDLFGIEFIVREGTIHLDTGA